MFKTPNFSLDNFEGPLELLLFLIQKEEMDLYDISLKALTAQAIEILENGEIDVGSEILGLASTLLLMKSQKLLPSNPNIEEDALNENSFEMIQKLIEYCRFRDTAKFLADKEEEQQNYFSRSLPVFRKELGSGLEEVGLEDLKKILSEAIAKTEKNPKKIIREEPWQIEAKLKWFYEELTEGNRVCINEIFFQSSCNEELIAIFLAILELMKQQFLKIVKEKDLLYIVRL